jgi:hypothetical protein
MQPVIFRLGLFCSLLAATAACTDLPRDPAGTTERVERTGKIIVGQIAGDDLSDQSAKILRGVAQRTGATVHIRQGAGEQLLADLEEGRIDLVYGCFAKSSPWSANVHLGPPMGRRKIVGKDERVPRFAFRNGENGWIAMVQREVP